MTAWEDAVSQPGPWPRSAFVHTAAQVGAGTRIGHHVYIGPGVVIGAGCRIQSGAVIGEDGFGYEQVPQWKHGAECAHCLNSPPSSYRWEPKPHPYGVWIGDGVHIGANTCIDRGSWRDTRIGRGARIDNLVHIAHNVVLNEHCMIVAGAEISGSVVVGDYAWIGPNACVKERVTVEARALIGIGAVVIRDVPANTTWAGNPARCLNTEVGVRAAM